MDGRILYASEELSCKVNMLDLKPGEPFVIVKRCGADHRVPVRWDVWRTGEGEKDRAKEERSEIEEQLRESIDLARRSGTRRYAPQKSAGAAESGNNGAQAGGSLPRGTSPHVDTSSVPPAPAVRVPIALVERSAADQPAMAHFPWCQHLLSQAQALSDVMAAAVEYAGKRHGSVVKPEDVRALVITCFINMRSRGDANVA